MTQETQPQKEQDPSQSTDTPAAPKKKRGWAGRLFGALVVLALVGGLGLGMLGLTLPGVLHRQAVAAHLPRGGKATRCIMIFLFGGPSQIDTWDMKPEAPREYRGEFRPITTTVPGILCCEHLPRTAKLAHHLAVVRSLTMTDMRRRTKSNGTSSTLR